MHLQHWRTVMGIGRWSLPGALLLVLSAFIAAEATPLVTETIDYYPVSADTLPQLPRALDKASPVRENGDLFYAYTGSDIRWQFWWKSQSGRCSIDKVSTTVDIAYTLPELVNSPEEVTTVWLNWYPNLLRHEAGHKDLAVDTANNIEAAISSMTSDADCKELEERANAIGKRLIKTMNNLESEYDKRTGHGATQGADLQDYIRSQ